MEKYSLLPINPQQLTPAQTALQRMSEKHLDFEIQAVNTIRPQDIEYTQKSQPLVPVDTPLSIITKHIPRQSDIDKIVKSIETHMVHGLELPIQAQDLIKAYQTSVHFQDIYHYITDGKFPSGSKAQNCIHAKALNYLVVNNFLFRIDTRKDKDRDKGNLFLLVIPEKYKPIIFNTYHDSLLAGHQGPFQMVMTIRQKFFIHNLMNKVKRYIEACHICLKTKPKYMKNRWIVCDEAAEFTSTIIQAILTMLNCRLKVISPYNHGSSKCERQIKTISDIIVKHLWDKGQMWPLFATTAAYAMNTFASEALSSFSPLLLVFLRDPQDLTSLSFPKIDTIQVNYHEYYNLLLARAQMIGRLLLEWRTKQALEYEKKNRQYTNKEMFQDDQMIYLLAPHSSALL